MDIVSRIKGGVSAAITRARLAAQLAQSRVWHARAVAVWSAVEKLPLPPPVRIELRTERSAQRGEVERWAFVGYESCCVWAYPAEGGLNAERLQCLTNGWRMERYTEHPDAPRDTDGRALVPWALGNVCTGLESRLATIDRKLAGLVATVA